MNYFHSIILSLIACLPVYSQKQATCNGWEFLEWGTDSAQVQKIIKKKGKELRYPNALDASFRYQDMNTWLYYDAKHTLNKVKQRIDFSVNRHKEASSAYKKIRQRMFDSYDTPRIEKRDTVECNVNIYWDLMHTTIHLEYDYKYKIIDEFGAGSYWVEIVFEKKE